MAWAACPILRGVQFYTLRMYSNAMSWEVIFMEYDYRKGALGGQIILCSYTIVGKLQIVNKILLLFAESRILDV